MIDRTFNATKGVNVTGKFWQCAGCAVLGIAVMSVTALGAASEQPREASLEEVRASIEANGYSWTAGRTPISDLSPEESEALLGLRVPDDYEEKLSEIRRRSPAYAPLDLPSRFDWTDSSGVSPVRRQFCGDCWAQCAVASVESKMRIFDGDTRRLSVQQAIDCNYGGSSCNGGWWGDVYDMYRVVGAIKRSHYPYVGSDQNCYEDTCRILTTVDGWDYVDTTVVSMKTHLMSNGPMAVGMTVLSDFNYYTGGCYENPGGGSINHGVLLVGWDDSMCDGEGAWHIKNSWGTGWGEGGYAWIKYGNVNIGAAAAIVYYTPRDHASLVYQSSIIDDSAGDSDGKPDAGETITLPVSITNEGWEQATNVSATIMTSTPGVQVLTGSATFPDVTDGATEQSDSPHFSFSVDGSVLCGVRIHFIISMASDQGVSTDTFDMLVGDAEIVFSDDATDDLGWSLAAGDDDASAGFWKRKKPTGSFQDSMLIQTERDHTPGDAVKCFLTSNINRNFGPYTMDVDGGKTTLTSPIIDLEDYASANLRYWRWYTSDTGEATGDVWVVDVSADSGASWVSLENETESERDWVEKEFDLGDHVVLTDKVLMRFIASDYGDDSVVEAAVDDIEIAACPHWVDTVPASVGVAFPDGGEILTENTEVDVAWTSSDDYGVRQFAVTASYDDGMTFDDTLGIVGGLDTSLTWLVPAGEHAACRIGVEATDRGYNTTFDQSDSPFSITLDVSAVDDHGKERTPGDVELLGSESNPFTGSAHIFFALPRRMEVTVRVYDARGRLARELLNAAMGAGYHSTIWEGRSDGGNPVSPGVYFIHLEAEGTTRTAKVVLAR
jgi:uncharacterized repeat protein (TIGR01451 family)